MKLIRKIKESYELGRLLARSELEFMKSVTELTRSNIDADPRRLFTYTKYNSIRSRVLDEMERISRLERASFSIGRVIPYFKLGRVM